MGTGTWDSSTFLRALLSGRIPVKNLLKKHCKTKEIQETEQLRCKIISLTELIFLFNILVNTLGSRMWLVLFDYTHTLKNEAFWHIRYNNSITFLLFQLLNISHKNIKLLRRWQGAEDEWQFYRYSFVVVCSFFPSNCFYCLDIPYS